MKILATVLLLCSSALAQGIWGGVKSYGGCTPTAGHSYSTTFPTVENPLLEGCNWTAYLPLGWNNYQVNAIGSAVGTATNGTSGLGDTKDSTASVVGTWGNDQQVSAQAKVTNKTDVADEEIELRTRTTSSVGSVTGYEFQWFPHLTAASSAVQMNRWNGAVGAFTLLAANSGVNFNLNDGDTMTARSIGTTHQQYINGVRVAEVTDATYASGKPGLGSYYVTNGCAGCAFTDFGHKTFRATDAPLLSKASCAANNATGASIGCAVNTTGTGCMGVWVYWNSTTATASVSGSTSGAFTSAVGPTTILGSYRMQGFQKCGYTTNAADTITATFSLSGIDHAIAVSAVQGVTAFDVAPAINAQASTTSCTSNALTTGAADTYLLASTIFGGAWIGGEFASVPNRFWLLQSANFGGNVLTDGIGTVNGASITFTSGQGAANSCGTGIMSFK